MANMTINNAVITGCSVVIGEHSSHIDDQPEYYNNDKAFLQRLKKSIGIDTRHVAASETTASDLCHAAAARLLAAKDVPASSIEAIISVTQTPDYSMPGNAHVLHHSLGLSATTPALDVGLACSGYVYGLWLAAMMVSSGLGRVLLVAGDTMSKAVNKKDRTTAPLFGDAGSATLVERSENASPMYFALRANGSGLKNMYIPAGAYRAPSDEATRAEVRDEKGCVRSQEDFFMDGFGTFEFTMTEQPGLLREILAFSQKDIDTVDFFIFHQANRYIVQTITKKAGIPPEKAPSDVFTRFGNQSSASIPAVLCDLSKTLAGKKTSVVLQGFGQGLSWGACQTELDGILCLPPAVYVADEAKGAR